MKNRQPSKTVKFLPALALTFGALAPMPASASIVEECLEDQCTITFGYTGQIESLTFPDNATNVHFEVLGAQGGKTGGGGGLVTGTFTEVPEILYITVGGAGGSNTGEPGGFNGGGASGGSAGVEGSGGGASDIRIGYELSSRIVVAGGGGGRGSGLGSGGGAGGGLVGANGRTGQGAGGLGGTQSDGGLGGATNGQGTPGTAGDWGVGGTGGYGPLHGGGGGGGGYYGGGGGGADADSCCTDSGGGGGGSSYTDQSLVSNAVHTQGVRFGAGQITISYRLISEGQPAPPAEEPIGPSPSEPEASAPEYSVPIPEQVKPQPEPTRAPPEELSLLADKANPEPPLAIDDSITALPEDAAQDSGVSDLDEIHTQPSNLRQAAQSVVVPLQTKPQPWNSHTLLAGLIGIAVFALVTGLVVARRGVPGAISS
jgi:hypothetical protein